MVRFLTPFGSGTTLVEAVLRGKVALGIDYDSFSQLLVRNEIVRFEKLPSGKKEAQLRQFLATPEGNVILGQAPTVGYYVMLCIGTDLCMRDGKMLRIKKGKEKEVQGLLKKFEAVKPHDFGDDLPYQLKKNLDAQAKIDRLPILSITMEEFLFFLSMPSRAEFKDRLIKMVQEQLPSFKIPL